MKWTKIFKQLDKRCDLTKQYKSKNVMRYGALLGSNLSLINKVVGVLVGPALGHYWFITSGKEQNLYSTLQNSNS